MEIPKHVNWPGWEVVRRLGAGSFGSVYEIQRDLYGKTEYAALKVISIPQDSGDIDELYADGYDRESITQRFRSYLEDIVREYAMMAEMKGHANVVYCDDLLQVPHEDGLGWDIYIKMELLTPLVQALPVEIPEEQVIRLGADICSALVLCKQRSIIHRDIKPQNIFISRDGNYKLGDFGIAKTAEKTSGGTKTGTYKYMAPEVYKGEPYGTSVDVYSLGLVLYWMLNERRTPFLPLPPKAPTTYQEDEAKHRRFSGEPLPPPAHGSKELQAIVLKACAYRPQDRFKSAAEMLEALHALQQGEKDKLAVLVASHMPATNASAYVQSDSADEATAHLNGERMPEGTVGMWQGSAPPTERDTTVGVFAKKPTQAVGSQHVVTPVCPTATSQMTQPTQPQKKKRKLFVWVWVAAVLLLCVGIGLFLLKSDLETDANPEIQMDAEGDKQQTTASTKSSTAPATRPSETEPTEEATLPAQADWSDWSEELPDYVSEEGYEIQTQTLYSSRRLETTSSTQTNSLDGWELYDTANGNGDFGAWSEWSQNAVNASQTREVQSETRYRSSNKETKTSNSSSLNGWELYDTTYAWGSYGAWSDWTVDAASSSDSRKVETMTQYRYRDISYTTEYTSWSGWSDWQDWSVSSDDLTRVETRTVYEYGYFSCPSCGNHWHGYGFTCFAWGGGCGRATIPESSWTSVWGTTPQSQMNWQDWHGTGHTYAYYNGERVFRNKYGDNSKTQYRYSTRSTYQQPHYGSWSSWSNSAYSSSSTREVETRTVYRYCDRAQIPTYHFYRWSDWSGWTTSSVSSNNNRKVEKATFYRYRDRVQTTTYYFRRWTAWSDYTTTYIGSSDTVEVRTVTRYSYKSK